MYVAFPVRSGNIVSRWSSAGSQHLCAVHTDAPCDLRVGAERLALEGQLLALDNGHVVRHQLKVHIGCGTTNKKTD